VVLNTLLIDVLFEFTDTVFVVLVVSFAEGGPLMDRLDHFAGEEHFFFDCFVRQVVLRVHV